MACRVSRILPFASALTLCTLTARAEPPAAADVAEAPASALMPASCALDATLSHGEQLLVPCGELGVIDAVRDAAGQLVPRITYAVPGRAVGLFLRNGQVWVELLRNEAMPLGALAQAAPAVRATPLGAPTQAAAAPDSAPEPAPQGRVVARHDRELTVSLGRPELALGDHVELYERTPAPGGGERETSLAVGQVVEVSKGAARLELGLSEEVPQSALARPSTRALTRSLVAPPRIGGLTVLEGGIRPFLPTESLGIGVLADLAVTYLAERPFYARVELQPVGGILSARSDAGLFTGYALLGYDQQYFAVGMGVGLVLARRNGWATADEEHADVGTTFSVKQAARLGARDGLHLRVDNSFVLGAKAWHFAYVQVGLQLPLGTRTWLTLDGAGGEAGRFLRYDIGLRRILLGNGGAGSLFVRPSVGVAGVVRDDFAGTLDVGPMVGVHLEWRM